LLLVDKTMIKLTKKQTNELMNCHIGVGLIVFKSADNELTKIEFFTGKDNKVRKITDRSGEPELVLTDVVNENCNFEEITEV